MNILLQWHEHVAQCPCHCWPGKTPHKRRTEWVEAELGLMGNLPQMTSAEVDACCTWAQPAEITELASGWSAATCERPSRHPWWTWSIHAESHGTETEAEWVRAMRALNWQMQIDGVPRNALPPAKLRHQFTDVNGAAGSRLRGGSDTTTPRLKY